MITKGFDKEWMMEESIQEDVAFITSGDKHQ